MSLWNLPIDPNSDEFRWFLEWLVDEKDGFDDAKLIIGVSFEPHKYKEYMNEYLKWRKYNE